MLTATEVAKRCGLKKGSTTSMLIECVRAVSDGMKITIVASNGACARGLAAELRVMCLTCELDPKSVDESFGAEGAKTAFIGRNLVKRHVGIDVYEGSYELRQSIGRRIRSREGEDSRPDYAAMD